MLCYFLLTVCDSLWNNDNLQKLVKENKKFVSEDGLKAFESIELKPIKIKHDSEIFKKADGYPNGKFSSRIICTRNLNKGFFRIFYNYRGILTGVMCYYHPLGQASLHKK